MTLKIPPEYEGATADKLTPDQRMAVERMSKKEPNELGQVGIQLLGPVGSGKTFIAWAMADYFVKTQSFGKFPVFMTESELLDRLRYAAGGRRPESYKETFLSQMKTTPELLILDDFGATRQTDFSIELLTDLLEYRISWHLPTIITSNVRLDQPQEVEKAMLVYGERILSRINGRFEAFVIDGDDRRLA